MKNRILPAIAAALCFSLSQKFLRNQPKPSSVGFAVNFLILREQRLVQELGFNLMLFDQRGHFGLLSRNVILKFFASDRKRIDLRAFLDCCVMVRAVVMPRRRGALGKQRHVPCSQQTLRQIGLCDAAQRLPDR